MRLKMAINVMVQIVQLQILIKQIWNYGHDKVDTISFIKSIMMSKQVVFINYFEMTSEN